MSVRDKSGSLDPTLLDQMTDLLGNELAVHGYRVVPRSQVKAAIQQLQKDSYSLCVDEACQIELGKAVAAQRTVAPSVIRTEGHCVATAGVYDLRLQAAVDAATVKTDCTAGALMDGFRDVAAHLAPIQTVPTVPGIDDGPVPPWARKVNRFPALLQFQINTQ